MDTACSTFFSIPELVATLANFLSTQDLIQLSRTNRAINVACSPLTWQTVNVGSKKYAIRLLNSPEALQAFGNNITSIRSIYLRPKFSWYYLYTLWAYLNITAWPAHRAISTDALADKNWGGMLFAPCLKIRRLPPMLRLTRLEASLTSIPSEKMMPNLPDYNHDNHIHHLLWLVRLNSNTLTHLELTNISLRENVLVRDVARSVSQLHRLKTLQVSCMITCHDYEAIFLSCPSSLVDLRLAYKLYGPGQARVSVPDTGDWDFDQGPLVRRETPLHLLKYLVIPGMSGHGLAAVVHTILRHSPALEVIQFPLFEFFEASALAKTIAERCPHLSQVSFPQGGHERGIAVFLEEFPVQRLRRIYCSSTFISYDSLINAAWTKHSTTLRWVEFTFMKAVSSRVIKGALTTCEALETFRVTGIEANIYLTLADAVESEWVCKRIQVLEIVVLIYSNDRSPKFQTDPSKETWTEDDHRKWDTLGILYAQIGALTELQVLDLQTVEHHCMPQPSSETALPGLLALEDSDNEQIGYLSRLAGLTKLRALRGSVRFTVPGVMERLGKREIKWFVDHLPALRVATFVQQNNNGMIGVRPIRQLLRILEKKRPELKFSHNVPKK